MLILMLVILMLLNLNIGYVDTDADICFRIMSLCCFERKNILMISLRIYVINMKSQIEVYRLTTVRVIKCLHHIYQRRQNIMIG